MLGVAHQTEDPAQVVEASAAEPAVGAEHLVLAVDFGVQARVRRCELLSGREAVARDFADGRVGFR
jgi:hypothetical protein